MCLLLSHFQQASQPASSSTPVTKTETEPVQPPPTPTGPPPYQLIRLPNELIGRTEILGQKIYVVGQAPKGPIRARTTILYDKRYPAEAFNHEEYFQVLVLPEVAPPEQKAIYQQLLEAVRNHDQGKGFRSNHPDSPAIPLRRPSQVASGTVYSQTRSRIL